MEVHSKMKVVTLERPRKKKATSRRVREMEDVERQRDKRDLSGAA